ncbi:EscU/YscU/HrcU family type III secretion system export apparatus switch protein [Ammoniphilus sp. 3BR4]|uniref:EscU/YscU/HrcU family type III secretion system export apparatus switch protein n=1 Tax=Ammoniphilus sp. 3BR4 TaxID=3158265 RepID=UPI0034655797
MTNEQKPIKRAAAITYSTGEYEAPIVSAKGKGEIADSIIKKAQEHGIPIQEDKALIELLSKIELHQQIPPELFQIVAEILASVYRMERKARGES